MSHQKFSFAEAPASGKAGSHLGPAPATRKHRRKKVLPLHSSSKLSFDASLDSTICDDSTGTLTYSSSSQAGESTDSEHNYCGEEEQNSLNYSEDDEASLHRQQVRDTTGQTSDSYGHDGGGRRTEPKLLTPPPMMTRDTSSRRHSRKSSKSVQPSDSYGHDGGGGSRIEPKLHPAPMMTRDTSSRRHSRKSSKSVSSRKQQAYAPTAMGLVASDVSLSSGGTNTPSSPPPRYSKRMSSDPGTEVWYAKWWMCGFTDALNINSNY